MAGDILVLVPPGGGHTLNPGNLQPIKWDTSALQGPVLIVLRKGGKKLRDIDPTAANTGFYPWTVPAGLPDGDDYQVRIRTPRGRKPVQRGDSEKFTIRKRQAELEEKGTIPFGDLKTKEQACADYAKTAIAQNERNQKLGCGFFGPAWQSDDNHHYGWCLHGDNIKVTKAEQEKRQRELTQCTDRVCTAYADRAVLQNSTNNQGQCGFTGPRWSSVHSHHKNWCMYGDNAIGVDEHNRRRADELEACIFAAYDVSVTLTRLDVHDDCDNVSSGDWHTELMAMGKDENGRMLGAIGYWPGKESIADVDSGHSYNARANATLMKVSRNQPVKIAFTGVDCDFEESGMLGVALNEKQAKELQEYKEKLASFDLASTYLEGEELETEIKSPIFLAGLNIPHGAILNPAKLAREMKRVVEEVGVEVRERTVVTRITPGKINHVDTELGEIRAPILVIALNAYAQKLGFFKEHVIPVGVFQVATESLSKAQWASIGFDSLVTCQAIRRGK